MTNRVCFTFRCSTRFNVKIMHISRLNHTPHSSYETKWEQRQFRVKEANVARWLMEIALHNLIIHRVSAIFRVKKCVGITPFIISSDMFASHFVSFKVYTIFFRLLLSDFTEGKNRQTRMKNVCDKFSMIWILVCSVSESISKMKFNWQTSKPLLKMMTHRAHNN